VGVTEQVAVGERLLSAIARRDYESIERCFAPDARFEVLTPHELRSHSTAGAAADRYRYWLERLEEFGVLEHDAVAIADRVRIRYLFRGRDPRSGWQLNEHTGYATVDDGRIVSMTLTCAGFRPIPAPA
jgi:ketosteroid isomerase-like protein